MKRHPEYIAVKQGSPELVEHAELIELAPSSAMIYCGSDALMLPSLAIGAHGVTSTQASLFPEVILSTYTAYRDGRPTEAQSWFRSWSLYRRTARRLGQPAMAKAAARELGCSYGDVRPPLTPLKGDELSLVTAALDEMRQRLSQLAESGA